MKLVYISKGSYSNKYRSLYKSMGIEVINYINPIKAVDNFKEISPDIVYFKEKDFPRLWKIVLSALREEFDNNNVLFVLEAEQKEEISKAFNYLSGNIIICDPEDEIHKIKDLITKMFKTNYISDIYFPEKNEIGLGFLNPSNYSFISGSIIELNNKDFIFAPENISDIKDIAKEMEIQNASINIGEQVVNLNFSIANVNKNLTCKVEEKNKNYQNLVSSLFV